MTGPAGALHRLRASMAIQAIFRSVGGLSLRPCGWVPRGPKLFLRFGSNFHSG